MDRKCKPQYFCNMPSHKPPIKLPPEESSKKLLTAKELEKHYWEWYNSLDG